MAEFGASALLQVSVDDASMRSTRREIEQELGDVSVSVDASAPQARSDGGSGRAGAAAMITIQKKTLDAQRASADFDEERNEILRSIEEILDEDFVGEGGVSGGGGGLGFGEGALAGRALGGGGGGLLGGLGGLGAGALAMVGGAATGLGIGLLGVRGLQETGTLEDVRETGQDVDAPEGTGAALSLVPGLGQLIELGTASTDLASGDLSFSNFFEMQGRRLDLFGDIGAGVEDTIPEPTWLTDFTNAVNNLVDGDGPTDDSTPTPGPTRAELTDQRNLFRQVTDPAASRATKRTRQRNRFRQATDPAQPVRESGGNRAQERTQTQDVNVSVENNAELDPRSMRELERQLDQMKQDILDEVDNKLTGGGSGRLSAL